MFISYCSVEIGLVLRFVFSDEYLSRWHRL